MHPVSGKTRNVSSHGFYCLVQEPIESGETVECTLVIPIAKPGKPDAVLWLKCQARPLRVEAVAAAKALGIAFLIEEYCVVHLNPVQITPAEKSMAMGK
jgi:hypothetical protein